MSTLGGMPSSDDSRDDNIRGEPEISGQYETDTASTRTKLDGRDDSEKMGDMEEEVEQMVRQLTRHSTRFSATGANNPFFEENKESTWHPDSPFFKTKDWIRSLLAAQSRDPERFRQRNAGVAFKDLHVHGFGSPTDYQKDVFNSILGIGGLVRQVVGSGLQKVQILNNFNGMVRSGEMLLVLGRPGSGCSTLLKTIAGEMNGIYVHEDSYMNYQGISSKDMQSRFRGEAIFSAENDVHFPQLTVGDTLTFAAQARAPRTRFPGLSRKEYANHVRDVVMTMLGLRHTFNTRVGNDFVRGVSGGERKRVSIAEAILSGAPLQCWDNSTRGLDSANALEFCKNLQLMSKYAGTTACVAIYQASQNAYDVFDKVVVLYEGHQIYFGPTNEARQFFTDMGFDCPQRQTTADFLTSLTSPSERRVKSGFEDKVPRTPMEFAARWRSSPEFGRLLQEIEAFDQEYPIGGNSYTEFGEARRLMQSKQQRAESPYTLSVIEQVNLCLVRGFQRLKGDASLTTTAIFGNFFISLILGSVFYDMPSDTSSFYSRGVLLFYAVLMSAFSSALEILTLYAQRPIVEKQARYAFYHPFAEAIASMLCDLPYKITNSVTFNLPLYFLSHLRREPGPFFIFWLFSIVTTLTMSMIFRSIGAGSRSLAQALVPAAILILGLVIYTGFIIPTRDMLGWSRWMNYIDPIAYAFESLMVNEFDGRDFPCLSFIPSGQGYEDVDPTHQTCSAVSSSPGLRSISGTSYVETTYQYTRSHLWRNLAIMIGFMVFFMFVYLLATELVSEAMSKGEVLIFRRGHQPKNTQDSETPLDTGYKEDSPKEGSANIQRQTAIFQWQDLCYDIKIKGEPRRILDHVNGWVKPGTATALMGVSGAGKTTLLDVLATRVTMGVVSGEVLVDGQARDDSFQRKTGYVQQQDAHLQTSTVREALQFSALLRQPAHVSRQEKLDYVEEVLDLLGMQTYADAIVGVPGEGLNVEQRKRLTIGVELAAKPQLLLFLDEPTSGLDSQTSWSILDLIETLTKHGQAILCTIHQPSAMLFQRFNRLLFLAKGGRTVYFGEIGENSSTLANYFIKNGGHQLSAGENPAEWMLDVIGAAPGSHSDIDWPEVWNNSPEKQAVCNHLAELKSTLSQRPKESGSQDDYREFAAPTSVQLKECLSRVFSQYWRTPSYIYSKLVLSILTALYNGFSFFKAKNTQQGLQNQMFSIFMLMTIFGNLCQQLMPNFLIQRSIYEVRERPSKMYSWRVFMAANILVELPWNLLVAILMFVCWYYPVGLYQNAEPTNAVHERGALMFLFMLTFLWFTSTFAHMIIAGVENAETGGNIANLIFVLLLLFCGVVATPEAMPGFWIFMYRLSPFTYLVSGMLSTAVSGTEVTCDSIETLKVNPPPNQTCSEYLGAFAAASGGRVQNPDATSQCAYCAMSGTDTFLASVSSYWSDAWRNFGLMWVYIAFNIVAAIGVYWLARVPKGSKTKGST
ncbi:pleiotropic drug resistance family ABC transporter [Aspergillus melleus]|uniref:pleiotropic drug resistance family ABC transporter n=1 Tax=Aspergillus melleus TaxID=138277 RepID=UPI001E8D0D8C|nr:Multidrug resistance protein [Aspergillus melleus]KAH8423667.1 Multidrug resistance protein [Aspergillus melleus]